MRLSLTRGLALVLPLCLAVAWLWPLADPLASPERGGMGEGSKQEPLAVDADVVVVGNSLARHGVDLQALASALQVDSAELIWQRGSGPPLWYAALKNNLFAHGGRAKLVIIVNTMSGILDASIPEGRQLADLRRRLTPDEPVLGAKVFGHDGPYNTWDRLLDNRRIPRDRYVDAWKALGSSEPDEVLGRVFAGRLGDQARRVRMIPIVELEEEESRTYEPETSLLAELIALAHANDSQIVFARIPIPESGRDDWPLTTEEETKRAVALIREHGAGYVDLHALPLSEADFLDNHHLSRRGQRLYTAALAEQILQMRALDGRPAEAAPVAAAEPASSFRFLGGRRGTTRGSYVQAERILEHGAPVPLGGGVVAVEVPELEALSIERLQALAATEPGLTWVGKCSPVRARENEEWLSRGGSGPDGLAGGPAGRYRHTGQWVQVKPQDPKGIVGLSLTPDRGCRAFTWVYPGDDVVFYLTQISGMQHRASVLTLGGFVFGEGEGRVVLTAGDQALLDQIVQLEDLDGEPLSLTLTQPLEPSPSDVSLRLEIPADGPFILLRLGLLSQ